MTTNSQFVEHLDAAIADLDTEIASLTDKVAALTDIRDQTVALRSSYGSPTEPEPAPEPDPTPAPVPLKPAATPPRPTTTSAAKRGRPRKSPGTAGGLDYTAIAADITELRAAGKPVQSGLIAKHHVPDTTVKNWIAKCRQLGLIPKEPAAGIRVIEDNTGPEGDGLAFDAALVAETYRTAVLNNKRPVTAVEERFRVQRIIAIGYIDRAREAGALAPKDEPQLTDEQRRALLEPTKEPAA